MVILKKYAQVVLLSTLGQRKSLAAIGTDWFQNRSRLYQPANMAHIKEAVNEGWLLIEDKRFYRANMEKLIEALLKEIATDDQDKRIRRYKENLRYFYIALGEYTQKVYLNYDIIEALTGFDHRKAMELDLTLLIQLPFILRCIEIKDKDITNLLVRVMHLEQYLYVLEELHQRHRPIIERQRRIDEWIRTFGKLSQDVKFAGKRKPLFISGNIKKIRTKGR